MRELPVADYFANHYSPEGHQAVATVVVEEIADRVSSSE
jgi:hypothetical protein